MRQFLDRRHAGRLLASMVSHLAHRRDVVVLGLPRGGIPVAFEVAIALDAPLHAFAVRKVGAPDNEEFAIGALASGGIEVLDWRTIYHLGLSRDQVLRIVDHERRELERRELAYQGPHPLPALTNTTVVLVDDGLATGSSMLAAVRAVRANGAAQVVVAVPVATEEARRMLGAEGVECHCIDSPEPFLSVGAWYRDFTQTTDGEVRALLDEAASRREAASRT